MNKNPMRKFFLAFLVMQFMFCFSGVAFAGGKTANANDNTQETINKKFCRVINILKGGPMKTVAIIGVMAVGIGTFTGRFQWSTALITVAGVLIIFSAEDIVGLLTKDENDTSKFQCDAK